MKRRLTPTWRAWTLSGSLLAGVPACAFERELLSPLADVMDAGVGIDDAGAGGDGGFPADAFDYYPEAGSGPRDTGIVEDAYWPSCDNTGTMFDTARTGDRCSFVGGCPRSVGLCGAETAFCTGLSGLLYRSTINKPSCAPDLPGATLCARPSPGEPCCFETWPCVEESTTPSEDVANFCSDDCGRVVPSGDAGTMFACPDSVPNDSWSWPPASSVPCVGAFVCDSAGRSLGSRPATLQLDPYGRFYFCANGALQRVAAGPSLPWN